MLNKITINAHSSVRIGASQIIYVDPFQLQEEKHDADFILFTHPHYDHLSPEDFAKAAKKETVFVIPASAKDDALKAGINEKRHKKGPQHAVAAFAEEDSEAHAQEQIPGQHRNRVHKRGSEGFLLHVIT